MPQLKYQFLAHCISHHLDPFWIKAHPRKELMRAFGVTSASKMYIDGPDGQAIHTGYILAGHWFEVMRLAPLTNPSVAPGQCAA